MPRKARVGFVVKCTQKAKSGCFASTFRGLTAGPAENTKVIGLVKDFPKKADAEREAQRLGLWKLLDPVLSISPTFGELAQHFRIGELKRNGPLSRRAAETVTTHESMLDGYILPKWASVRALDMTVPMVEEWFEELALTPVGRTYADGQEAPNGIRGQAPRVDIHTENSQYDVARIHECAPASSADRRSGGQSSAKPEARWSPLHFRFGL